MLNRSFPLRFKGKRKILLCVYSAIVLCLFKSFLVNLPWKLFSSLLTSNVVMRLLFNFYKTSLTILQSVNLHVKLFAISDHSPNLSSGQLWGRELRGKLLILAAGVFSFECVTLHQCYSSLSRHELITKVLICSLRGRTGLLIQFCVLFKLWHSFIFGNRD